MRLFRPECPGDRAAKAWIEEKLDWLSVELPDNVFTGRPLVLPDAGVLPRSLRPVEGNRGPAARTGLRVHGRGAGSDRRPLRGQGPQPISPRQRRRPTHADDGRNLRTR